MLGLLVVGILVVGSSPGYGQGPDPGATPAVPVPNGIGPEVVPIVTRAWAHDDFGRMVFDWPWAVAYGARIEGKTLTVMFDRRLHTTFQQIPRHLGAYITDVDLGPDGQSVVVSLTDEYRLRTFLLNNEDGGVKVVVDLLADGGAGPVLAQAPTPPSLEPSPEAVPGDATHPSPTISGDSPFPLAEAVPEAPPAELPPSLPFAAETGAVPEDAPESSPPGRPVLSPVEGGAAQRLSRAESKERGGSTDALPPPPDPNGEQTTGQNTDQAAAPSLETVPETPGENPPRPFDKLRATPPERGEEEALPPVKADADVPLAEPDTSPESVPNAEVPPSTEETAAASEAEAPPEETSQAEPDAETVPEATPQAEPTPETVSEETPQVETATSPHPDPLPEGEGEAAATAPAAPQEETAAATEDPPSTETAKPAAKETPPVTAEPTPESLTPSPQFPTLPVSVRIPLSQSRLFRLETPVASVFVANPEIADVQLVSSGVLFVVAKAVGRTSVAALDADSELVGEWTIATVLDIQPARAAIEGVPALKNVVVRQLNRGIELSGNGGVHCRGRPGPAADDNRPPGRDAGRKPHQRDGQRSRSTSKYRSPKCSAASAKPWGSIGKCCRISAPGASLGMRVGRFFFSEATRWIPLAGIAPRTSCGAVRQHRFRPWQNNSAGADRRAGYRRPGDGAGAAQRDRGLGRDGQLSFPVGNTLCPRALRTARLFLSTRNMACCWTLCRRLLTAGALC